MPEPPLNSPLGTPFIELSSVDSTNNYALTQLRAGMARHGTAFFAHEQYAGRGQRGKTWSASRDTSIILSVIIDPQPIPLGNQFQLSACVAVAAADFLRIHAGDDVRIKWPNDLYWRDRKAGGILIENIVGTDVPPYRSSSGHRHSEWLWSVAGIGINVNQEQFSPDLKNPVSLCQITGKQYQPADLARELCRSIDTRFNELVSNGFSNIYERYLSRLYKKGQTVKLRKDNRVFEALIIEVDPDGRLVTEHGIEESFGFGEIEWVIPADNRVN